MPTVYSPPVSTYVALATTTLSSTTASVTFGSISGSYRDLVLVVEGSHPTAGIDSVGLQFNGDTGSNYSRVVMQGNGSTTASSTETSTALNIGLYGQNENVNVIQIMDYSASDKHTTVLARANATSGLVRANAGRWADTSVITSILVNAGARSFQTGDTLSLYGIEA